MKRTLMIGDTTHDLQMAANAGAASVAVEYGAHEPAFLHKLAPMYSAKTVQELHVWLNQYA
jgi:phosphoglycolate phosphatase